jgi:hypothetical protein
METPYRKDCSQGLAHVSKGYSMFKSGRINTNIEPTLYKALIKSVMTYACPTWQYAADAHFFKLRRLH